MQKSLYHGRRFPAAVISFAVRWYFRLQLSLRDIEEWHCQVDDAGVCRFITGGIPVDY
jgi:transposase-like protein